MTVKELKAAIDEKSLAGAVIFCGEEEYLKRHYRRLLHRIKQIFDFVPAEYRLDRHALPSLRRLCAVSIVYRVNLNLT